MTGIICSDCESEIVDECGIFDSPNVVLCRGCFEKKIKKKVQNTLLQYEKREKQTCQILQKIPNQ